MRPLRPEEEQWVFSKHALENTPSRSHGVALKEELERRKSTIMQMRSLLARVIYVRDHPDPKLKPTSTPYRNVILLAATFVHRFYMRRSLEDFKESLMAATLLWMASKLEENQLKVRHLVNVCLDKYEQSKPLHWRIQWRPMENGQDPSDGYRFWEKRIVVGEQLALEALCFDLFVEQPWVIIRRAINGLDAQIAKLEEVEEKERANTEGVNGAQGKRRGPKITEELIMSLAWPISSEASLSPLSILYPSPIIAFAFLAIIISLIEQTPLSRGISAASEIADKFELDIRFTVDGPEGEDVKTVKDCLESFTEYVKMGLIDRNLVRYLTPEPRSVDEIKPFKRSFVLASSNESSNASAKVVENSETRSSAEARESQAKTENSTQLTPSESQ
ncbi:hypothetical protein I307_01840 [Cryptococcus deuterogattii 99/473]|uniref:Cyclin N-terminal domain-containing protein n=1 Tax=Cryptococcus deuterogattii Ram5 TaxID=1296110 RepID=A0A0D0T3F2_9TREE|nr:hypothetical protein I313_03610 [Cryptococcus deuterogattii Ram5]KIY58528.1 hypothetical protein I307_01840 [Cryptococcus deuterogattii 99/473]